MKIKKGTTMETDSYHFIYRHWRVNREDGDVMPYQRGITEWKPAERGGGTECFVYDQEGILLAIGMADCSLKDSYVYRIGRDIARGRALKSLQKGLTN